MDLFKLSGMKNVPKLHTTTFGNILEVSPDLYFHMLSRDKAYNVVEEYVVQTSNYGGSAFFEEESKSPSEDDVTYSRYAVAVNGLNDLTKTLKKQLSDQLKEYKVKEIYTRKNLNEALEEAMIEFMNNFGLVGDINKLEMTPVLIKLSKTKYLLAPTESDSVRLKQLSPIHGAVLVYKPTHFVSLKLRG